jgi:hypothetical protein
LPAVTRPGRRARQKVAELLAATQTELDKVTRLVQAGKLAGAAKIGVRVGKVLGRFKVAKHFDLQITDTSVAWTAAMPRSPPRPRWTAPTSSVPP